ncbi:efflux RND transporter periplasmic adaptor subunit [Phycisphaera mikurensis]|uniref:Peptidase M50 family protein n=1 Tax=Phycisphaera mikurensis (strain NBRC 102666 / KCTC 22515 / FYK2301M01) TaxID=1142394 RepID=I0IEX1_PHYMF|nr:efflux RND transporter periplasmic adaptor subunit [Phycisphaera mikurensis]MBB6441604.1 putative peptide zinc metalloprotease protein [Phycisphaera mikurensis]BAM03809.1 peptidase M50 family protein [Phycisphaera mikurensis NBRC 102666]
MQRPTFHESWYRISALRPRLRAVVQVFRQRFRGKTWHVLRDPANNQFFRLDDAGFRFVGLLDGKRTVGEAWEATAAQLGDRAPTQGEAVQVLGQLYQSNLIAAELPADAEGMFDRFKRRRHKQVGGYLMNIMFAKIPLFDPEHLLERWKPAFMWIFGPVGVALWLALIAAGLLSLGGRAEELLGQAGNILDPSNWILLYAAFGLAKVLHEFGHAFAVKAFGRSEQVEAEVHVLGVMLLVLVPVPYVDATGSWAFRSKWRRAFVGAAGMYVELALAAVAAIVWSQTSPGVVHALAYNVIFIAGVSTILFNANPLIRFDGYYILSDLTETPNLYQRSNDYLKYLVRRFAYRVREPHNPAQSPAERPWLAAYGVCSLVYRVLLFGGILLFVIGKMFFVGALMAAVSIVAWLFVPLGKWVRYLLTSPELARTRGLAQGVSLAAVALVALGVGVVPAPDRQRAAGLVEPDRFEAVFSRSDGFIDAVLPTLSPADQGVLVAAGNRELLARRDRLEARLGLLAAQQRKAEREDVASAQVVRRQHEATAGQLARVRSEIQMLSLSARVGEAGQPAWWVGPDVDRFKGAFVPRGEALGVVASLEDLVIRVAADQHLGPRLRGEEWIGRAVEVKTAGRPDLTYAGRVERVGPAGTEQLPSAALGFAAGGPIATDARRTDGTTAAEAVFEVRVRVLPTASDQPPLRAGQRVMVRFRFADRPLMTQAVLALQQLFQGRVGA